MNQFKVLRFYLVSFINQYETERIKLRLQNVIYTDQEKEERKASQERFDWNNGKGSFILVELETYEWLQNIQFELFTTDKFPLQNTCDYAKILETCIRFYKENTLEYKTKPIKTKQATT